jgi:hypothetical protein
MGRIQYEVVPHGTGWRMRTCGYGHDYATQIEALFEAMMQAKAMWDSLRAPTAVRVRLSDGAWREARVFGDEIPEL